MPICTMSWRTCTRFARGGVRLQADLLGPAKAGHYLQAKAERYLHAKAGRYLVATLCALACGVLVTAQGLDPASLLKPSADS